MPKLCVAEWLSGVTCSIFASAGTRFRTIRRSRAGAVHGGDTPFSTSKAPGFCAR